MGRWGDGVYEDDSCLNFLYGHVTVPLRHKLAYLLSPEEVRESWNWIIEVTTIIEIMLLFDTRPLDYNLLLHVYPSLGLAKRCREATLKIWDGDWACKISKNFNQTQRKKDRAILVAWLERIVQIATFHDYDSSEDFALEKFAPDVPLPYFSLDRVEVRDGHFADFRGEIISTLVESLVHTAGFYTSPNRLKETKYWRDFAEVIVAVDVIGQLCQKYKVFPYISLDTLDAWEKFYMERYADLGVITDEELPMLNNERAVFQYLRDYLKV